MQWVMAAALICSASVFTSCTKQDNPVNPADNLAEMIIGKWILADRDGQPAPTNLKRVITFVSATKAYMSASFSDNPDVSTVWNDNTEADVVISGNKMTLTMHPDEQMTVVDEYIVTAIDATEYIANLKVTATVDGKVVYSQENIDCLTKINRDHSEAILGLWECKGLKGGETYNDGDDRLEFFEDGTYKYYRKNDAGEWEEVTTREFQNYFVDGTLLATRWKNVDEDELREWWEIAYLKGDKMQWKALRANEDGTTFGQIMDWEKVE
jgi:hypothetical protein